VVCSEDRVGVVQAYEVLLMLLLRQCAVAVVSVIAAVAAAETAHEYRF
jgi:hypothetical protein